VQYLLSKLGDNLQFKFYNKDQTATAKYHCSKPRLDNFLFVNIPKCATQTIAAWAAQMATRDGSIEVPYRFTILREPYGRLKSAFAYGVGAKYQYKFTVEDIGDWFFGKNLPEQLTPNHADLFVHFVPQTVFIDNAPIAIDHWHSTGDMRQLRRTLSYISRCNVGWQEENRSRYTEDFTIKYNTWFSENKEQIDNYLSQDIELYTTHISS
jgi:hypothetical protein